MKTSIIVDIDGTIADCSARLHHIRGKGDAEQTHKTDWDAFYADVHLDKPIVPVINLVKDIALTGWFIILITGRSDSSRAATIEWLSKYRIPWNMLLMRKTGDHTQDYALKRQWLHDIREGRIALNNVEAPRLALEDRNQVVQMWREEGIVALQCAEGDF